MSTRVWSPEDREDPFYYNSRTWCAVLQEMREIVLCMGESNRERPLLRSLIEELQVYGNRMENGLGQKKDLVKMDEEWHRLKNVIKKLRAERDELKKIE